MKCRVQIRGLDTAVGSVAYRGIWECATTISKKFGIRGIMQGMSATCARSIPSFGICYLAYEGIIMEAERRGIGKTGPVMLAAGCT